MIISGNKIIKVYKNYVLPHIKLSKIQQESYSSEKPNIGVIDLETFQYDDNTYKVYAAGFKTY
jgi:hypothetical protein